MKRVLFLSVTALSHNSINIIPFLFLHRSWPGPAAEHGGAGEPFAGVDGADGDDAHLRLLQPGRPLRARRPLPLPGRHPPQRTQHALLARTTQHLLQVGARSKGFASGFC